MMCTENTLKLVFLYVRVKCMLYGGCVLKLANEFLEREKSSTTQMKIQQRVKC